MAGPLGAAPGIILGVGLGTAGAAAIEPIVEPAKQQAWADNPNRILDAGRMAALVAQGGIDLTAAYNTAKRDGFDKDKLDALVYLAQRAPTYAEAQDLKRRGKINLQQLYHAFAKEQIEVQYWAALADLVDERLSPEVVALAVVRGLLPDPGILPVGPPTAVGKVPAFPQQNIPPFTEAAAGGIDEARLKVLAGIAGRPMGPEAAAAAVFRNILERVDYDRAIAEGDVRNEWADSIFETARQIPSVADYINAEIRGWINTAERNAGIARHGMRPADGDLLYLRTGRPAAPGQMATAAARGINGPDGVPMNRAQFLKGIRESDIRPEWGEMLWEARFLYPPLFQLTRLVQAGAITADVAAEWATKDRYPPEVVTALHAFWSQPVAGTDPDAQREKLAVSQAIASLKKRFLAEKIDGSGVVQGLELLGVKPAPAGRILETWTIEQGWTEKLLTPSQIKKAYRGNTLTQAEAVQALMTQYRYTEGDAMTLLNE